MIRRSLRRLRGPCGGYLAWSGVDTTELRCVRWRRHRGLCWFALASKPWPYKVRTVRAGHAGRWRRGPA